MRFMFMASLSSGALVVTNLAPDLLPKSWKTTIIIAILVVVFNLAAMGSRLVYQRDLDGNNK